MVFEWKKDATGPTGKVKAKDAGNIIKGLEKKHGGATPSAIVAEARPDDSPIHPWFEWDNSKAAEKHRQDQARSMVQQIVVVYESEDDSEPIECRAFVTIREGTSRHYASTARVLGDDELRQQVVNDVLSDISHCKNKLKAFDGFSKVLVSLDKARTALQKSKAGRGVARRGRARLGSAV